MKRIIIFICFAVLMFSGITEAKTIKWNGKVYVEQQTDILDGAFDMCKCIKVGMEYYPNKSIIELNSMCFNGFKEYLLLKSEKENRIVSGVFINEYCNVEE